jgi:hypothetical protein
LIPSDDFQCKNKYIYGGVLEKHLLVSGLMISILAIYQGVLEDGAAGCWVCLTEQNFVQMCYEIINIGSYEMSDSGIIAGV